MLQHVVFELPFAFDGLELHPAGEAFASSAFFRVSNQSVALTDNRREEFQLTVVAAAGQRLEKVGKIRGPESATAWTQPLGRG